MGTGQIILLIGSLILLIIFSLNFYNSYRSKSEIDFYNQALITGTGIGQSIIDEIQTRSFDQKTVTKAITSTDSLTAVGSLGPESGETSVTKFNDADDYKNYVRLDTLGVMGIFKTQVNINYATKMNPDLNSLSKTFTKRIDVFVTNTYLQDTLKLKHVITY
ncbi:MAG: hypothetical protein WC879_15275 [Melioribacteraceae bacterium]